MSIIRDLINILEWMNKNKLTINLQKTQCMVLGTEQRVRNCSNLCIQVESVVIENVSCAKL